MEIALGMAVAVVVTLVVAGRFLPHQTLWIDETTQLSGLSLSPTEVVRWLTHPDTHDMGVPGDRMPPLSYWIGWLWSRPFGASETSMRWFGVVCTAGAAALVFSATQRAFGLVPGLFAALFLALSPNVAVMAVEIRSYPLFLLTSAGVARAVVVLRHPRNTGEGKRSFVLLTVWLLAAIFTHFFGALLAGVVTWGLAVERRLQRRRLRPVLVVAGIMAVALVGLAPFVIASASLSTELPRDRVREVVQLVYRLIGHPSMTVYPVVTAAALGAAALLVVTARWLPARTRSTFGFFALLVVGGIAIAAAANFLHLGFTAAKVTYATWALPLVAMCLAAPLALRTGRWARVAQTAAAVLCLAQAAGVAELWRHGSHFAHGPHRELQRVVERLRDDGGVAVVHVDSTVAEAAQTYYPLRFENGPGLAQFVAVDKVSAPALLGTTVELSTPDGMGRLGGFRHLVAVRSRYQTAAMLASQIRHGDTVWPDSAAVARLESQGWRRTDHHLFVAFVAADVTVLDR